VNLFRKRLLNNIFFSSMFFKKHSMREQNCWEKSFHPIPFFPKQAQARQSLPTPQYCLFCFHSPPPPPSPACFQTPFQDPPPSPKRTTISLIVGLIAETSHTVIWRDIGLEHLHSRNIISLRKKEGPAPCLSPEINS
jgi:hypothetical protein